MKEGRYSFIWFVKCKLPAMVCFRFLDDIGRLCSVIVSFSGHLVYYFCDLINLSAVLEHVCVTSHNYFIPVWATDKTLSLEVVWTI